MTKTLSDAATKMKVIVVDDNPRDREFLLNTFSDYTVAEATNGEEAIQIVEEYSQPWIISDIQMPKLNGIEFAKAVWQKNRAARIVFWTQFSDEMYLRALIRVIPAETVYGYVLKTNTAAVLRQAVHAVFEDHQCWIDPSIRQVQGRVQHEGISDAEYDVLIDIALGLTDKAVGLRRFLSRRGAQNRLKSLYQKLGVDMDLGPDQDSGHLINLRSRAVCIALARGLINPHILEQEETRLQQWLQFENQNPSDL